METSYDVRIWKIEVYSGRADDELHGPVVGGRPARGASRSGRRRWPTRSGRSW